MEANDITPEQKGVVEHFISLLREGKDPKEILTFKTNIKLELRGPDGALKDVREVRNLITTAGKDKVLAVSSNIAPKDFAYLAIGTGTTAANVADTTLQTEVARSSVITPTNPDIHTLQFVATFAAGVGTGTITEAGLLSAASVGTLLNHQIFGGIVKAAGDSLTVTVQIT